MATSKRGESDKRALREYLARYSDLLKVFRSDPARNVRIGSSPQKPESTPLPDGLRATYPDEPRGRM